MQAPMSQPQGTASALGQPSSAPEPVDFSEALLTSEKLPSDLPDDAPAGVSQAAAGHSPAKTAGPQSGTPVGTPTLAVSSAPANTDKSVPSTPLPAGPEATTTPVLSAGPKYQRHPVSARPSPMSTTTLGPRLQDPSVFTVTNRRVRITEAEKYVPLYVVIRKWIQNDPDSEIMPPPAHGDDLAEAKRSLAPKLPAVPAPTEEELKMDVQPIEAPAAPHEDGPLSVEGLKKHHMEHWGRVRSQHSKLARLKINRFRSRLVALLQSAQPAPSISPNGTLSLADITLTPEQPQQLQLPQPQQEMRMASAPSPRKRKQKSKCLCGRQ